jgi:hypothetical protein
MTTWQSNDDVRRDGGAEVAEFDDAPPVGDRPKAHPPQAAEELEQYPDAADLPEPDAPSRPHEE